jgi:hypothetical protein
MGLRVVNFRDWLTLDVPFLLVYRVYGQLVTAIMPAISGNKRDGEESFYTGGPGGQHPEDPLPLPGD